VFILPITKREAVINPTAAVNLLNETLKKKPASHLAIYTDGSLCQQTQKAACGIYVPKENIETSWSLSSTTSILTAELTAIWKALTSFWQSEYELISIITDSRSSIQVIKNYRTSSSPLVSAIVEEIYGYNSAGTKVEFIWIPSHCKIGGNERADRLAQQGLTAPTAGTYKNKINKNEKIATFRMQWTQDLLTQMKKNSSNVAVSSRWLLNPLPWHQHKNRRVQVALFRLRSNHNRLNYGAGRFNTNVNKKCPYGCNMDEDNNHVLMECPEYNEARAELIQACIVNKAQFTLPSILGLERDIPKAYQSSIQKALAKFIIKTGLINRL